MLKKLIFAILLIGFIFNISHDFVFYKIDPCMKTVESLTIEEPDSPSIDPLCDIHKNFHMDYIFIEKLDFKELTFVSVNNPIPKNLSIKPIKVEIFKPPT